MTRALAAVTAALLVLHPRLATACPACVSSPYGDRTYNVAYIGLLLVPFLLALVIGGILAWSAGYRLDVGRLGRALSRRRPPGRLASPPAPPAPGALPSHHHLKETT
jgi:hypothetical protein